MKLIKKIKLKLNKECKDYLEFASEKCRLIYNFALQESIDYYKLNGRGISIYELKKKLPQLKIDYPEYKLVYNKCLSTMYFRLEKAFRGFFTKIKGFPKFKRKWQFISQEYSAMYIKVLSNNLFVLPAGNRIRFNIRTHESIPENFSTVTIQKEKNNYFACFTCEYKPIKKRKNKQILAIDLGIKTLCSGINNKSKLVKVESQKLYFKYLDLLRSKRDKKKKNSKKYNKWNKILQRELTRYRNRVNDYLHKASNWICEKRPESTILVGDLNLNSMLKEKQPWFNRIVQNEWRVGRFVGFLEYKAKKYGKDLIKVNEYNTTKTCSNCGNIQDMTLDDRVYICKKCNFTFDRDFNSSINILNKYLLGQSGKPIKASKFDNVSNNLIINTFIYN
jgi:putative transposase